MAPPGVDTNTFYPLPIRHDLAAEPYILSVSRFDDPRKNVDLLLTAYQRLLQIVPAPPRLLLAGSGRPPERVMRRMRELGLDNKVHFHHRPSQAELSRYYREALCFVLSSDEEGFGIVVTEAMASGVPVVATRCGGPDGIVNDGVDGFLVEVGDAEGLAQKVASLVIDRDLNSRMGLEARLTADSRFSRQATKQAILKAYDVVRHRAVVG
jgi:glycosyltransferase involved in cell wall biosynthesis